MAATDRGGAQGQGASARRIGITGHRWTRLKRAQVPALSKALSQVLVELDDTACPPVLVSGMAEGVDLLAARLRPAAWGLEAALALPLANWLDHLRRMPGVEDAEITQCRDQCAVAKVQVLSPGPEPDFGAVATHLVTSCHHLVAVWDGAGGYSGGTADVLEHARRNGLGITVLRPDGRWVNS